MPCQWVICAGIRMGSRPTDVRICELSAFKSCDPAGAAKPDQLRSGSHRTGQRPSSRPLEALGGKLVAAGYPFGEYDAVVLYEAPDDTSAAAFALAIAGGAAKSAKTTRLLSGQEWIESLRKAQGSQYRPPQ